MRHRTKASSLNAWLGSMLVNLANLLLGLATGVIAARLLLPVGRGKLAEIVFWGSTVAALGSFALPSALAVATAREPHDSSLLSNAVVLNLILALVSALLFTAIGSVFIANDAFAEISFFVWIFVPANFLGLTLLAVDQGHEHFVRYNLMRLVPQGVYLSSMLAFWRMGALTPLRLALALWAGSAAVVAIRSITEYAHFSWDITFRKSVALLRIGAGFHVGALASILLQRVDQFVLITWFDHKALGLYAVALNASGVGVGLISNATSIVLLPKLARTADLSEQQGKVRSAVGLTMLMAIFFNSGMAIAAPRLVPLVFGHAFVAASSTVIILCVVQIPMAFVMVAILILQTLGDWRPGVIAPMIGLIVFSITAPLVVPALGSNGVAIALGFAWLAAALHVAFSLSKRLKFKVWECLVPRYKDALLLQQDVYQFVRQIGVMVGISSQRSPS